MLRPRAAVPVTALAAAIMAVTAAPALAAPDRDETSPLAGAEAPTATPQSVGDLDWYLRATNDPAGSTVTTVDNFGAIVEGDFPLVCDARSGSDVDAPALVNGNEFTLPGDTVPAIFRFGRDTDYPLCGDWDGDGVDTAGLVRDNTFYFAATNTARPSVQVQRFGRATDFPVVGDWDGDGVDTVGLVRGNRVFLSNAAAGTPASVARDFVYGRPNDFPVVGDWDGSSTDNIGLVRGNRWFLSTSDRDAATSSSLRFGRPDTDLPVAGDWDGDGTDTLGVVRIEL